MGGEKGKGKGFLVSGKTRLAIPKEWGAERGGQGLWSGSKPQVGLPGRGRGIPVTEGNQHPRSGRVAPGGRNLRGNP